MPVTLTNPVTVGLATKKEHYDTVFNNTVDIYGGELAVPSQAVGDMLEASSATQWRRLPALQSILDGRVTLSSLNPTPTTDVTAATTLYYTPAGGGNRITLWNGSAWQIFTFAQISIAVPATTNTMYDVTVRDIGGPTLELLPWTNDVTRATSLALHDGVLAQNGFPQRRYVATIRTTGVSGQCEDSLAKRYVWNYANQTLRPLRVMDSTNSWAGAADGAWRQLNGSAANQIDLVVGWLGAAIDVAVSVFALNDAGGGAWMGAAIGENTAASPISGMLGGRRVVLDSSGGETVQLSSSLRTFAPLGRTFYTVMELSTGTSTFFGDNNLPPQVQSGIHGWIWG